VGTVVIEASGKSGARMQARLALEHGKRVLLMRDLVMHEEWAQLYERRGATVVDSVDDILAVLDAERAVPQAMQLF
jgi:DNA processing protein